MYPTYKFKRVFLCVCALAVLGTVNGQNAFAGSEKTSVSFIDLCSRETTLVSTPNGNGLRVKIEGLNPNEAVNLQISYSPKDAPNAQKFTRTFYYKYPKGAKSLDKTFSLPKAKWLNSVENQLDGYSTWQATVTWVQLGTRSGGGSNIAHLFRRKGREKFIKLGSEAICHWEEKSRVSSGLKENSSNTLMVISKKYDSNFFKANNRGLMLGPSDANRSAIPLSPLTSGGANLGWLFRDWHKQTTEETYFQVERVWNLNRDEGGVFAGHRSFSRHQAEVWDWDPGQGQCGGWKRMSEGHVDIGRMIEEFYLVPSTIWSDETEMELFINTVRGKVDSCDQNPEDDPLQIDMIIPSSDEEMIYYYKQLNL